MTSGASEPWWRNAVIYQVYIRSFADGNADGIGDIAGIRSRLPYLRELGVDALWITPWYPSPMADGGYDVADFRGIHEEFGTLAEAEELIAEAHGFGLRILLDIVPNHTANTHPWFQAALAAGPGSAERERYWFRPGRGANGELPPNDWRSVFGGPAWQRTPDGAWYLHLFAPEQPDLNWDNPEVRAEFESILRFWFDRGVDGFRIDVAHGLVKDPRLPDLGLSDEELLAQPEIPDHPFWDRDGVHDIYRSWRKIADSYDEPRIFVAEAWVDWKAGRLARYVRSDELHTAFNFQFLQSPWQPARLRETIDHSMESLADVGAPTTWVLSNHDVIRHVTRFGRDQAELREPAGVVPSDLALGTRRARAAALLMLALPGGAYAYQGEELGLPEVEDLPVEALQDPVWERSGHRVRGRDGCRVPLPWTTSGESLGFGTGGSWLPQPEGWGGAEGLSVEAESGAEASMLLLYRRALGLRKALAGLGDGPLRWVEGAPEQVVAFERAGGFRCAVNLGTQAYALPPGARVLLTSGPLDGTAEAALLPTDTAVWLDLS